MLWPSGYAAAELAIEHRLTIELIPAESRLVGRDDLSVKMDGRTELFFLLSERAENLRVEVDGRPRAFRFAGSELVLPIAEEERQRTLDVAIHYQARFDDPVPVNPLNTDNPGFGVSATIGASGVYLATGAGWYPSPSEGSETFRLNVKAPSGMLAVTAGRCLGHETRADATWSEWRVEHPVRGLALSAAAYRLREKKQDEVVIATYFLEANQDLAQAYLDAAAAYLKLYSGLFGPYPFPKFAVVENFFPTGYGFPSYTLLGGQVLRLPFILQTSLGHEIAHCWWGNGVLVDYDAGNWSEALTSYVSDYLAREQESPAAAEDYRRNALLNFSTLVPPAKDFPLARFAARIDPATKAVGYDKGAMVLHMLRRQIGEESFWGGLRDFFRDYCFRRAAWADLRRAFERRAGRSLAGFFAQWIERRGAPQLVLEEIRRERLPETGGWRVSGRIAQSAPAFEGEPELWLETATEVLTRRIALTDAAEGFEWRCPSEPQRLTLDPGHHFLRRLSAAEIPPTVNALKSSASLLVVLSASLPRETASRLAEILAHALGLEPVGTVSEAELDRFRIEEHDLLLVGAPRTLGLLGPAPAGIEWRESGFALNGRVVAPPGDDLFCVLHHPRAPGRVQALILPSATEAAEKAAAKVTHYGRYSFLAFRDGQNVDKGVWPPQSSPVDYRWPKAAN